MANSWPFILFQYFNHKESYLRIKVPSVRNKVDLIEKWLQDACLSALQCALCGQGRLGWMIWDIRVFDATQLKANLAELSSGECRYLLFKFYRPSHSLLDSWSALDFFAFTPKKLLPLKMWRSNGQLSSLRFINRPYIWYFDVVLLFKYFLNLESIVNLKDIANVLRYGENSWFCTSFLVKSNKAIKIPAYLISKLKRYPHI